MDWQLPAILFCAFVLAGVLTMIQSRWYSRELQAALGESTGPDDVLVSGKQRSFRGGAIVILTVDAERREVVRASAMTGATVFSRFRPRPELLGPLEGLEERARTAALKKALASAVLQMPKQHAEIPRERRRTGFTPTATSHT